MTGTAPAPAPGEAPPDQNGRPWLMLAVLLLGQFMGLVDVLVVNVAMPAISADLHASGAALQLVVGGYTVAYAMLLITGARLGQMYGRRRMYQLGVIGFTIASLACGFAPNTGSLILFRFVQGAAAAVMVPQIMSVIQMRFTGPARAKALSAYGAVLSIGAVVGLVLGGVIVSADLFGATWRPVFLVNVPLGILLVLLVPRLVPADQPGGARRLDFAGLAVAVPAVVLVVLPLVLGHELGWPVWTYVCVAAGLALAAFFLPLERRIADRGGDPLLHPAVLSTPGVTVGMATLSCVQIAYGGFLFVFTLHLQSGLGDSALRAGLTYIPMSAGFGLMGFYWRRLPARLHPLMAPLGLGVCAVAYAVTALGVRDGAANSPLMWIGLTVEGLGLGMAVSPLLTQSLLHVPMTRVADASGLLTTTVQLGQVLGVAVFGTVYLSLRDGGAAVTAQTSGSALAGTGVWLALLSVLGLIPAVAVTRGVLRARQDVPQSQPAPGAPVPVPGR